MDGKPPFDFKKLKNVYLETLKSHNKASVFDLQVNKGRFLFMLYLFDKADEDTLFIYMRNTRVIQKIKMYGNHKKGEFKVYITKKIREQMIKELCLNNTGTPFNFQNFLEELNSKIPLEILQKDKNDAIRENKRIITQFGLFDEAEKTVLIGDKQLPMNEKPQEKTLEKLYLFTDSDEKDVDEYIKLLKKLNRTVAGTTEDNNYKAANIRDLIANLSN